MFGRIVLLLRRLTLALCCFMWCHDAGGQPPGGEIDFEQTVAPILERRCLGCHSPNIRKGDFSLASAEEALDLGYLVPGDSEGSYLLELVAPGAGGEPPLMPAEGDPLSEAEVDALRRWIDEGATWPADRVLREASLADQSWWSLQPLADGEPPQADGAPTAWSEHPIDRFVWAKLAEEGLAPNPPADRRTLIRRATYDLIGLPPSPEEVDAFLGDESPRAYERLIERLLDSPHYGERWGRHWLDVVRFGESRGFERNEIITNLWPFRDYVIRSLNEDRSFRELIREHLAADVVAGDDPERAVGAAFLVCGPYDDVGNSDPVQAAQIRANTIDEMIRAASEAFLGLTVGCARCHDHKFDPITQQDYYGLYATFAGVRHGARPIESPQATEAREAALAPLQERAESLRGERESLTDAIFARAEARIEEFEVDWTRPPVARRGVEETFEPIAAEFVKLVVEGQEENPYSRTGYRLEEFEVWTDEAASENVALAAKGAVAVGAGRAADDFADAYSVRNVNDGRFGARWIAAGDELVLKLAEPAVIGRVVFSSDRANAAPERPEANFVCEYRILVSSDGETWSQVADSYDRAPMNDAHRRKRLLDAETTDAEKTRLAELKAELGEVQREIGAAPQPEPWWIGLREQAPGPFHVFQGGDPQRPSDVATPASLRALNAGPEYELAADCTEAERRLQLAEWIVDDGNPLSLRVLANRVWHYHFGVGIVDTPSDFGYMGGRPTHPELLDWLAARLRDEGWKLKSLHRLIMTSQTYRQATAWRPEAADRDAGSRLLWRFPPRRLDAEEIRDTLLSSAGVLDVEMGGPGFRLYRYLQDNVATYVPLDRPGPETYRRAVYHHNARAMRIDMLTDFDSPDCAFAAPRRAETTSPLQALAMWNHALVLDLASALAERLRSEAGEATPDQVRRAYAICFQRAPTEVELEDCGTFVREYSLESLCRVLLNSSELVYLP